MRSSYKGSITSDCACSMQADEKQQHTVPMNSCACLGNSGTLSLPTTLPEAILLLAMKPAVIDAIDIDKSTSPQAASLTGHPNSDAATRMHASVRHACASRY